MWMTCRLAHYPDILIFHTEKQISLLPTPDGWDRLAKEKPDSYQLPHVHVLMIFLIKGLAGITSFRL